MSKYNASKILGPRRCIQVRLSVRGRFLQNELFVFVFSFFSLFLDSSQCVWVTCEIDELTLTLGRVIMLRWWALIETYPMGSKIYSCAYFTPKMRQKPLSQMPTLEAVIDFIVASASRLCYTLPIILPSAWVKGDLATVWHWWERGARLNNIRQFIKVRMTQNAENDIKYEFHIPQISKLEVFYMCMPTKITQISYSCILKTANSSHIGFGRVCLFVAETPQRFFMYSK